MKYFKSGLSKDELLAEYRVLVKKYHPDICKLQNATEVMQEINEEYDNYFVAIQKTLFGFDWNDLFHRYEEARKSRQFVLRFMLFNKMDGSGWFCKQRRRGIFDVYECTCVSDDSLSWKNFHGGFALTVDGEGMFNFRGRLARPLTRVPARIECPTLQDMYFAMQGTSGDKETRDIVDPNAGEMAVGYVSRYGHYLHVRTKRRGEMWVDDMWDERKPRTAYMKVNGLVMTTTVPAIIFEGMDVIAEYDSSDFGFFQFQKCSYTEFMRTHDVEYTPEYSECLNCKKINMRSDFSWIDDPVVAHFARLGVVRFYEAGTNFRMRYGTFDRYTLELRLHELSIDDAERIQDFLDKINEEFEAYIKRMIKSGKLRLVV